MSFFDMLEGALGRPDPRQQIYAALGQGPGQPGGPPGPAAGGTPTPGAGGAAQPPGAAPAAPPTPPTPQAYQSPPDLAQMYMQLAQRSQAEQGFNNGLATLVASAYPGRTSGALINAMRGNVQDPGSMFGNLMQLQQFALQQQNLNAFRQGLPQMLKDAGLSQDYAPLVMANPNM